MEYFTKCNAFGIAIIFQGYISAESVNIIRFPNESQGMSIEEAAEYLSISVDDLNTMIEIEDEQLHEYGSFNGMRIPYINIDGKKVFYRRNLDEWLDEVTRQRKEYDFKNRITY